MLLSYPWPGNVRQLKNVIEQIALFESGKTVDAAILREYLPDAAAVWPASPALQSSSGRHLPVSTRQTDSDHTYTREREMLFSLIFKMKREIEALRADVDALKSGHTHADHHSKILMEFDPAEEVAADMADELPSTPVEEVAPGQASENPSSPLEEKEAIRQALDRNFGRRKAAALELNISERTLYRKIKEYGLD